MTYQQHLKTISNNFVSFGKQLNNIFTKSNRDQEPESPLITAAINAAEDDDDQLLDSSAAPAQNYDWLNSRAVDEPEESTIPPSNLMNRNSPLRVNNSGASTSRDLPLDDFVRDSGPSSLTPDAAVLNPMPLTFPASQNDPQLAFSESEGSSARLRSVSRGTAASNQTHSNGADSDGDTNHFLFSRKPAIGSESGSSSDAINPKWRYDDFETIDWLRDMARDRQRRRNLLKRLVVRGLTGTLLMLWDAASGWLCVLLAGLLTGLVAVIIDISSAWMSDLREGVCPEAWWLSKEQCCWNSDAPFNDSGCPKVCFSCVTWRVDRFSFAYRVLVFHSYLQPPRLERF